MKLFVEPSIEVLNFCSEDILTGSSTSGDTWNPDDSGEWN